MRKILTEATLFLDWAEAHFYAIAAFGFGLFLFAAAALVR